MTGLGGFTGMVVEIADVADGPGTVGPELKISLTAIEFKTSHVLGGSGLQGHGGGGSLHGQGIFFTLTEKIWVKTV